MNTDQAGKLRQLADHIISDKLGHKTFFFGSYNDFRPDHRGPRDTCGTSGCAIGECPVLFHETWKFDTQGLPVLRDAPWPDPLEYTQHNTEQHAMSFFGLTRDEFRFLFLPGLTVRCLASAADVRRHILKFLETKEITE